MVKKTIISTEYCLQGSGFVSCIPGMITEKEEGIMRKTTLKIMIAVGAAAVLMTGCFGS